MRKLGLSTSVTGLALSVVGTLLLFAHTTNEYHAAIQDIDSIALGYLALVGLGLAVSVTGVALLVAGAVD